MSKLTETEIKQLFDEVTKNWCLLGETGNVTLVGTFCSDELREIARVMDEIAHGTSEKTT